MQKIKYGILAFLTAAVLLTGCTEQRIEGLPPESSQSSSSLLENTSGSSSFSAESSLETYSFSESVSSSYSASITENASSSAVESVIESISSSTAPISSSTYKSSSSSAASSSASSSKASSSSAASSSASTSSYSSSSKPASSPSSVTDPGQCAKNGHTVVIDAGVSPTCTKTGLTQGTHCSVCNTVLKQQYVLQAFHVYLQTGSVSSSGGTASFICTGGESNYTVDYTDIPTEREVYNTLVSFKSKYSEGMTFTNATKYYTEKLFPNVGFTGAGCAAFAAELSDAAFGSWPARYVFDFSSIRVGDMIRLSNNGHSVIVLAVDEDTVTIAEANYNSSVHWGRTLKLSDAINDWNYVITRYPE